MVMSGRFIPTMGKHPLSVFRQCLGTVLPPLGVSFSLHIGN